jgi:hypothetical protein
MEVASQDRTLAVTPPTVTVPCVDPKLVPEITSPIEGGPDGKERPLICGADTLLPPFTKNELLENSEGLLEVLEMDAELITFVPLG